jgi:hypothetical protein
LGQTHCAEVHIYPDSICLTPDPQWSGASIELAASCQECLDHFIVFGERHLNHLCSVFIDYYHQLRPHQGKENELLVAKRKSRPKQPPVEVISLSEVRCQQKLGGLLKHYHRKAA